MSKKDIGLLVLILVVAAGVYLRNPLFLSPNNISNTANLIGLFGRFTYNYDQKYLFMASMRREAASRWLSA